MDGQTRVRGKRVILCSHFQLIPETYFIKPDVCNSHPNQIESLLAINKDSLRVAFAQRKSWASQYTFSEELAFLRKLFSVVGSLLRYFQEKPGHFIASHSEVCFYLVLPLRS